jgi:hypothetical protein
MSTKNGLDEIDTSVERQSTISEEHIPTLVRYVFQPIVLQDEVSIGDLRHCRDQQRLEAEKSIWEALVTGTICMEHGE